MDGGCCDGVETGEETVKIGGPASGGEFAEAVALARFLRWCWKEAVDEGAEVEAGSSGDDGEASCVR